jgi:hypothetical protein
VASSILLLGYTNGAVIAPLGRRLIVYHAQKVASQAMHFGLVVTFVRYLY